MKGADYGKLNGSAVRYMQPPEHFEKSTTTAEEQRALYAEQVKQLYSNAFVGLLASTINCLVLALIQRDVISRTALIAWVALLAAISLLRYRDIRTFWRRSPEATEAGHWGRRFITPVSSLRVDLVRTGSSLLTAWLFGKRSSSQFQQKRCRAA